MLSGRSGCFFFSCSLSGEPPLAPVLDEARCGNGSFFFFSFRATFNPCCAAIILHQFPLMLILRCALHAPPVKSENYSLFFPSNNDAFVLICVCQRDRTERLCEVTFLKPLMQSENQPRTRHHFCSVTALEVSVFLELRG